MQSTTNALDRMWVRLDELTDQLLWDGKPSEINPEAPDEELRAMAREVAWCIAGFYGGNMEWVRDEEMRRRALRERDSATA